MNELIKMYNISTFYPYLYEEKFKKRHFLHIDSGWIISNKNIYLNLEDINMLDDLGHILDFYRKIEKEGHTYRISINDKKYTTCCDKTSLHMCISCNKYLCSDHQFEHCNHVVQKYVCSLNISNTCSKCQLYTLEPMICINEKEVCYNCYNNCHKHDLILYTKPVIKNLNLYEWVPIDGFLENRNINSHLYKRKMSIEFNDNHIRLRLLDYNSVDAESDYILRLFEKLCIHEQLADNILKKIGLVKNYKNEKLVKYKTVIISS
jgi:hypothetical protein